MDGLRTFEGAVALITGGASGIGAALARALAARGATLVLADRDYEDAQKVAADLSRAEAAPLDVRDAAAFDALVASVLQRHGRLDYLFNNAGTGVGGEVKDYSLDDWRYIVEVNLMGVIHGVQAAYARMIRQGFGHIVNTASMAGLMAAPLATVYCTTKHAVVGLSRALRIEAREHGVRVGVLCPGVIRTPILTGGHYGRFTKKVPDEVTLKMWDALRPMDVDRFAAQVVVQVARNRGIIVVPRWWRLVWWANRLAPAQVDSLAYSAYLRGKAQIDAAARRAT
ncbi:MAG: SDR family oxidoreductase [Deltaproteobacteria bacterium]|nr:SDR family oxidoreductase [Deltaproteobacteria bacterium]